MQALSQAAAAEATCRTLHRGRSSGCLQGFALRRVGLERDEVLHDNFFGFTEGRTSIRRSTEELSAGTNISDSVK